MSSRKKSPDLFRGPTWEPLFTTSNAGEKKKNIERDISRGKIINVTRRSKKEEEIDR